MSDILKDLEIAKAELAQQDAESAALAKQFAAPTDADLAQAEQEIALEQQYGDQPVRAGLEGAARGISMGLSDPALVGLGADAEGLQQRQARNPVAATAGELAGVGAGLLLPTGPVAATVKAGQVAERAAAKTVSKLVAGSGRAKLAAKIAEKTVALSAQGAAEGAMFGAGHAVSEAALGNADLTAENILASMGHGAVLGGAANVVLGGSLAAVPTVARGIKPLTERVRKSAQKFMTPAEAAKELAGFTPRDVVQIEKRAPQFFDELPEFLVARVGLKADDSAEALAAKNTSLKRSAGREIDQLVPELDVAVSQIGDMLPSRAKVYQELLDAVDERLAPLKLTPESNAAEISALNRFRRDIIRMGADEAPVSFAELNQLRKLYDAKAKFSPVGTPAQNFVAGVAAELRSVARQQLDGLADLASRTNASNLAARLKDANRDYHLSSLLNDKLLLRAEKGSNPLSFSRMVEALLFTGFGGPWGIAALATKEFLQSDLRRKAIILSDVKKMADAFESRIKGATEGYVQKLKSGAKRAKALSPRMLLNSELAKTREGKQEPKNRKEAFKAVSRNLSELQADPEQLMTKIAKSTSVVAQAAPETAAKMHERLLDGVNFLVARLPKSNAVVENLLTKRDYEPSSLELAKFERYLQVVEAPATVLDELESGTLTTEHIEALKAVYPQIYQQVRVAVLDELLKLDEAVPYSKRVQLGILLDIPADESLTPESIQALQANFEAQAEANGVAGPAPAVKSSQTGLQSLGKSDRMASGTDALLQRRQQA